MANNAVAICNNESARMVVFAKVLINKDFSNYLHNIISIIRPCILKAQYMRSFGLAVQSLVSYVKCKGKAIIERLAGIVDVYPHYRGVSFGRGVLNIGYPPRQFPPIFHSGALC